MYNKYLQVNTLPAAGTRIPVNKGILVVNGTSAVNISFQFYNNTGGTLAVGLTFAGNLVQTIDIQPYALNASLPAGCTAFYLS